MPVDAHSGVNVWTKTRLTALLLGFVLSYSLSLAIPVNAAHNPPPEPNQYVDDTKCDWYAPPNWLTHLKAQNLVDMDYTNATYKVVFWNQSGTAGGGRFRIYKPTVKVEIFYDNGGTYRQFRFTNTLATQAPAYWEFIVNSDGLLSGSATAQTLGANQAITIGTPGIKCISAISGPVEYPFQGSHENAHPALVRPFPYAADETWAGMNFKPNPNPADGGGGAAPTPPPTQITERDAKIIGFVLMLYVSISIIKLFRFKESN